MPLIIAPIGKEMTVIHCRLETSIRKHLENLGLLAGAKVCLIKANDGDVIVQIKEARIALNKQLASKILVR